jgi:hypothetical protein
MMNWIRAREYSSASSFFIPLSRAACSSSYVAMDPGLRAYNQVRDKAGQSERT